MPHTRPMTVASIDEYMSDYARIQTGTLRRRTSRIATLRRAHGLSLLCIDPSVVAQ